MFDVGFFELLLIGVVLLLVVGPERLPKVARTAGMWLGRGRRFVSSVKEDIDREIRADELRQILDKQKRANPLHEIVEDTKKDFARIKADTEAAVGTDGAASGAGAAPAKDPATTAGTVTGDAARPDDAAASQPKENKQ